MRPSSGKTKYAKVMATPLPYKRTTFVTGPMPLPRAENDARVEAPVERGV
jgi:hypothetical protein